MPAPLRNSATVHTLARDLGLKPGADPLAAILNHCEQRVRGYVAEFSCETLSDLLDLTAAKVGTQFRRLETDDDLASLREEFVARGEIAFANLRNELTPTVFGITFRLQKAEPWERRFVSVIDCRGEKGWRSYFTKWHEVAHLLTLTPQARLAFKRTHSSDFRDPEEAVMDRIAGTLGFYAPIARNHVKAEISFDAIETLRQELCPEASRQSALIGLIDAWSSPCLLVTATPALKTGERLNLSQQRFAFYEPPTKKLRAVRVKPNQAARQAGFSIFENMRVPEKSVIYQVFAETAIAAQQEEDLDWWETNGRSLPSCPVRVMARRGLDSVEALIAPIRPAAYQAKARGGGTHTRRSQTG
jgi:hypothetical protein